MKNASPISFDRIDLRLLAILQENCRRTSEQLAELVHLSPTAVQRRLKRLRESGAIRSEVAIVDPALAGRPILMFVHVSLERERSDIIDRFKQAVRQAPEVMSAYHVTGETDFVLLVSSPDMEEFESFTRRVLYKIPEVKGFRTMVVMDPVKVGFNLPLPA